MRERLADSLVGMLTLTLATLLQVVPQAPVPDAENFGHWLEFIRPAPSELAYREIGWRNEFWPAVQEAKALGRPLLFWTMNGHPLGCT